MEDFEDQLQQQLDEIRKAGLYRELRRVDSPQSIQIELSGKALRDLPGISGRHMVIL